MKGRGLLFPDLVLPDIKPPYRLGVGDSITLYATSQDIFALDRSVVYAYVQTTTEKMFFRRLKNYKKVMNFVESLRT